jgi:hypothetical protein
VESVLRAFFVEAPDGYHQKRCDEEIQRFRAKSQLARNSANARWAHSDRNANASDKKMRTHKSAYADGMLSSLQSPDTSKNQTPLPPLGKGGPRQRRSAHRAGLDEARLVWSELIASGGAKRNHRIQAALDAVGGWVAVRMRTEHDEVRLQRAFCEAYLRGGESAQKNGAHQPLDPEDLWEREEAARADG